MDNKLEKITQSIVVLETLHKTAAKDKKALEDELIKKGYDPSNLDKHIEDLEKKIADLNQEVEKEVDELETLVNNALKQANLT